MKTIYSPPLLKLSIALVILMLFTVFSHAQTTVTFTTSTTWTVPYGVASVAVECWGGGGAGAGTGNSAGAGGGGGGGGYAKKNTYAVSYGDVLNITIGAGGTGTSSATGANGGSTYVDKGGSKFVEAAGGNGANGANGGTGGTGATGDTKYTGGSGGNGKSASGDNAGGGGGSGAGNTGAGNNGSNGTTGPATGGNGGATKANNGGAGGNGYGSTGNCPGTNGGNGSTYGGGGGGGAQDGSGCGTPSKGGNGAPGYVTITYTKTCTDPTIYTVSGGGSYCSGGGGKTITLSGSQSGVTYQLYKDAVAYGGTFGGTGSAISGSFTDEGYYTVKATTAGGYCDMPMSGGAAITCDAPWQQARYYNTAGTYTFTVPNLDVCNNIVLTVQLWAGGGGGGGAASRQSSTGNPYEACSGGGGGGGGGYTKKSFTVTKGQNYTLVVGAGGAAGVGNTGSAAAANGGDGGNSTFSGNSISLTAYGGKGGGGALTNNTSGGGHQGDNGVGGSGGSGDGSITYTGGNGYKGWHSSTGGCSKDRAGGGGGGAGSAGNGGTADPDYGGACNDIIVGGTGGTGGGGNGADGKGSNSNPSYLVLSGNDASGIGAGGSGAFVHVNNYNNTWWTGNAGKGSAGKAIVSTAAACFLPIELASFTGKCEDDTKIFTWVTATETNNNYFTLEQSTNGINFIEADKISGSGTSSIAHTYQTRLEQAVMYKYFRLKQTDYDGQFTYSQTIAVNCLGRNHSFIYPNPATNQIKVYVKAADNQKIIGQIFNVLGELITVFEVNDSTEPTVVSVNHLAKGMYNISLVDANSGTILETTKLLKQ